MRQFGVAALGLVLAAMPAMAQKPGPAPSAAPPGLPTTKPPPLGGTPPRAAVAPPPPAAAAPPSASVKPGGTGAAPPPAAAAPPPSAAAPPATAALPPPPANEAPAIQRLRAALGAEVQMAYREASVLDPATGRVRLLGVQLARPGATASAEEAIIDGQADDGVREVELRGLATVEGTTRVTVARVRLNGLTVRRPAGGGSVAPTDVTLDRFAMEGLRVESNGVMTLGSLSLEDFGTGRRSRLALETLGGQDFVGVAQSFTLARLALNGVDLATVMGWLVQGGQPQPQSGRLELTAEGFSVSEGTRVLGGAQSLSVESDSDASFSGRGRIALRGLRFDGVPVVAAFLGRLGYQALVGDVTMESIYRAEGGVGSIPLFEIVAPGFGRVNMTMEMDGLQMGTTPMAMVDTLRLVGMGLRYRDEGLIARALRAQAAEQRVTERQLREQGVGMAGAFLSGPALAGLREPILRFMRGQASELEITARPPQPIPLQALQGSPPANPEEAQQRFGLTAVAR